jgi:hypothetical protein
MPKGKALGSPSKNVHRCGAIAAKAGALLVATEARFGDRGFAPLYLGNFRCPGVASSDSSRLQEFVHKSEETTMRKTFAVFACLSVMMLTVASYREIIPQQPGYTLAGTHVHNCPKGKYWDGRQKRCVK